MQYKKEKWNEALIRKTAHEITVEIVYNIIQKNHYYKLCYNNQLFNCKSNLVQNHHTSITPYFKHNELVTLIIIQNIFKFFI